MRNSRNEGLKAERVGSGRGSGAAGGRAVVEDAPECAAERAGDAREVDDDDGRGEHGQAEERAREQDVHDHEADGDDNRAERRADAPFGVFVRKETTAGAAMTLRERADEPRGTLSRVADAGSLGGDRGVFAR